MHAMKVLRNTARCATLFKCLRGWAELMAKPTFLFFDERLWPKALLRDPSAARRVAFVAAQLSDSLRGDPAHSLSLGHAERLVWRAGRLLVLRRLAANGTSVSATGTAEADGDSEAAGAWCVESEVALVHLNLLKTRMRNVSVSWHLGFEIASRGFGIRPLAPALQRAMAKASASCTASVLLQGYIRAVPLVYK